MTRSEQIRIIFPPKVRRKVVLAMVGTVFASLLDTTAVLAVAPLLQLLMGAAPADITGAALIGAVFGARPASEMIAMLGIVVISGFVIRDIFNIWFQWWNLGFVANEQARTSVLLMDGYMNSPYSDHVKRSTASYLNTLGPSVGQVYSYFMSGAISGASSLIVVLVIVGALVAVSPIPALLSIAYFGIVGITYNIVIKPRSIRAGKENLAASKEGYAAAFHALGAFREIKLRDASEFFLKEFERTQYKSARASRAGNFYGSMPKFLLEMLFIVGVGVLTYSVMRTSGAGAALASVSVFVAAGFRLLPVISSLLNSINLIRLGTPGLSSVADDLQKMQGIAHDVDRAGQPLAISKEISLENVTFSYGGSAPVIKNVSLSIPVGSTVAFVGGSGAGKSTLVDIILGLQVPSSGRVSVDGVDISEHMLAWRRNIAIVPQDVFLLTGSIAQNIVFDAAPEEAGEELLDKSVKLAQLDDVVRALPDGIETDIGERGARLSGGQRQRIGIARALYREPSVLVLDEATSALDNETEHRMTEMINALKGRLTVIVVAHRLSTIKDADLVVYMVDGEIRASGTFEDLQKMDPGFRRLVELGSLTTTS
ncbi:ABC transporter ATP-binding protein [Actinomyces faecalis]|uniref:ABC transporter ATP-binding protein n=1 Tax=Actinomyces faecalis TaxID=2722820 RepID=UPI001555C6C1|nr:ABC transporter ATP-binding protein [Actinomyces faecalis]